MKDISQWKRTGGKWNTCNCGVRNIAGLAVCGDGWGGTQNISVSQEGQRNGVFLPRQCAQGSLIQVHCPLFCWVWCPCHSGDQTPVSSQGAAGKWGCTEAAWRVWVVFLSENCCKLELKWLYRKRCVGDRSNNFFQIKNCQIYFIQTKIWFSVFLHLYDFCILKSQEKARKGNQKKLLQQFYFNVKSLRTWMNFFFK